MQDFKQTITDFPKQFEIGFELAKDIRFAEKPKNIIFCGMGGSIIPVEILLLYLDVSPIVSLLPPLNFHIHRDYGLPDWANRKDLAICISWSGGTEETLSSYKAAGEKGLPLIVLTKGGKIGELAQKDGIPLILLPRDDIPPRMGAGYMFSALYSVLAKSGIIEAQTNLIEDIGNKIKIGDFEKKAEELAKEINNKTPLIYSSYKWRNLAAFWKIFFNENAKIHAFWNGFPSMAHQELAGFNERDNEKFFVISLLDKADDNRYQLSVGSFRRILQSLKYNDEIIFLNGNDPLEKIFNNYLFAALTSAHLAQLRGVDPAEAELIEEFKKM